MAEGSKMSEVIRKTISFCPYCFEKIPAEVMEINNKIFLRKNCPSHGEFKLLLSNHPDYYKQLHKVYFSFIKKTYPQRDYLVNITSRCNLNCPICLANSNERKLKDYPLSELRRFLKGKRNYKIGLMGAEPTMRKDLSEIIKLICDSGNIAELHTNGIKIADFNYLKKLKEAGLKEVHFQFDGFDDEVYQKIRGQKLLDIKLKALENLKRLGLSVDLKVTIVKGINEKEMAQILKFALKNSYIKEVFYLGCRNLGRARKLSSDAFYMPDELIDCLQEQAPELIKREHILKFQKLYYLFLSLFSVRKCFYNQHYLIVRENGSSYPISEIFDLDRINRKIEDLIKGKNFSRFQIMTKFIPEVFNGKNLKYLLQFLKLCKLLKWGFDISEISKKFLLLGFISACDSFSYDEEVAKNCGKGAISLELGIQDMGALDNVMREKFDL
jgi:hypothetical protein